MKSHPFHSRRVLLFLAPVIMLLLLLAGIIAVKGPFQARASSNPKLYVGHTLGLNKGCSSPGFISVQAAVDAAPTNSTVYLCGTTPYFEQVVIQKAITLTGDSGATIAAPNPFPATLPSRLPPQFTTDNLFVPQAIVFVWGTTANVNIKNLTITGALPGNGGCAEQEFGLLVISGATVNLSGDKVQNIHDVNSALYGCQFGVGIQIGREYWPTTDFSAFPEENFVGHATIKNTTVSGYQKNGITIDGPGTTASVSSNTVIGDGRNNGQLFSSTIAQNGIQFGRGAKGSITSNTITGNSYTGAGGASSGGILLFGGACGEGSTTPLTVGVKIQDNKVQDNDVGVFVSNLNVDTNNNCALPSTPTNIVVNNNRITNSANSNTSGFNLLNAPGGYQAGISDEGYADSLTSNKICGVGYTPLVTPPPYLSRIDIVATDPIVSGNSVCSGTSSSQVASTSAQSRTTLHVLHHAKNSPIK